MKKRLLTLLRFVVNKLLALLRVLVRFCFKVVRKIHSRKRYALPFHLVLGYFLLVFLLIKCSGDSAFDTAIPDKRVNDVTLLNPIQVAKEIRPHSIQEISEAIRTTTGPISIGGGRYSMGGQTAFENSLHIDTREFDKILELDTTSKQVTVQPGITWRNLQKVIDPYGLSIKIMQTYANFTVGGSLSVNCHGRYIGHGPIVSSVLEIKMVTANGEVITANRKDNAHIFAAAIGGYGGMGVIVEVTLQLVDNVKVERQVERVLASGYNAFFDSTIRQDTSVIFQNGDLYPPHYEVINSVSWRATNKELTDTARVAPEGENYWLERQAMKVVSYGSFGKWVRRTIDPLYYSGDKVVWRNREASYNVLELEPASREESTYVLQEYFIPAGRISAFIPKMKATFNRYDVNVINVSLRHAYADTLTYLSWAPEEVFAFVIYYKQGTDAEAKAHVKQWTLAMTDAILSENGRWYLPYQPHATAEQFNAAYPRAGEYFDLKESLDPNHRFTNKLLDKYNPYVQAKLDRQRDTIKGYYKDEAQSFLTVPEWYLVFNPKEYADFLEAGNNPSDFPFYRSIDEYWALYDRSMKLVSKAYPHNEEYTTMLDVIGVSITMEYTAKMLYENSIGRVFSWFSNGTHSDQESVIIHAQRAYSDFIYDKAWYEFEFMPWVKKVWMTRNSKDSNWLRKAERTLFFTCEFTFKAVYARAIEWAAKTSYDEPVTDIFLMVSATDSTQVADLDVVKDQDSLRIIRIPRWGTFTKEITRLAGRDLHIHEIAGNDEIVLSILTPKDTHPMEQARLLYRSRVVTLPDQERHVYLVHVGELLDVIQHSETRGFITEHVYDY